MTKLQQRIGSRCAGTALAGVLALAMTPALAGPPQRIVSLNKCTDQLLVALVEPARIASVSPIGADEFSFLADEIAKLPTNSGRGESILLTDADLVLAGPFESHVRRGFLARFGFEVLVPGLWTQLDKGKEQVRSLGRRLRAEAKAEALVAAIDQALERSRGIAPGPRSVLVLHRRGYTPGESTILDELVRHMGLTPHAERLGMGAGGIVPLERLVADPPDYLLMGESGEAAVDQGSALLRHPALLAAVPPERRLVLPARLTICGGPSTPHAIDALAAEVRAKVR